MKNDRGRPKGRRVFKYKVYLTSKQIKWLKSQKTFSSISSLVRQALDTYMHLLLDHLKGEILKPHSEEKKRKLEYEIDLLEEYLEK